MARRDDLGVVAAAIAEQLGDHVPENRQRIHTVLETLGVERTVSLLMQALTNDVTSAAHGAQEQPACRFFQRVDCANDEA